MDSVEFVSEFIFLMFKIYQFSKKKKNHNDLIGAETKLLYRDPLQTTETKKQITMTVYN